MPTSWKRPPEELHSIYCSNTEAFYRVAGRGLAPQLDSFVRNCTLGLWSHSTSITQEHVDAFNQLYSKGQIQPTQLLWGLTGEVCTPHDFLPPLFFWTLTEQDAQRHTDYSRIFVRMVTNLLLYMAAVDDEVTFAEAAYITECSEKLTAICDAAKVKPSKPAIRATEFVTSGAPSFTEKHPDPAARPGTAENGTAASASNTTGTAAPSTPNLEEWMAQLDELVGLETVKADVKSLVNLMKVRKLRENAGLPIPAMSLHLVFTGNPGTGKTTVARLLAGLYAAIGVLEKGQLVEVDRSGLVAGYVGQTALRTSEVIQSALGGILFIDEAYALATGGENDFGREAIDTLLKAMEDHRNDLVVIVAGYSEPMERFLSSNPGLESRFNKYIAFPDYTGPELLAIFDMLCRKNGYTPTEETHNQAAALFQELYETRDDNFGNGRDVRNLFESIIARQANRLAAMEAPTKEDLMTILPDDLAPESPSAAMLTSDDKEKPVGIN